jgi:hypothetical protein
MNILQLIFAFFLLAPSDPWDQICTMPAHSIQHSRWPLIWTLRVAFEGGLWGSWLAIFIHNELDRCYKYGGITDDLDSWESHYSQCQLTLSPTIFNVYSYYIQCQLALVYALNCQEMAISGAINCQNGSHLFLAPYIAKWSSFWGHKLPKWLTDPLWKPPRHHFWVGNTVR